MALCELLAYLNQKNSFPRFHIKSLPHLLGFLNTKSMKFTYFISILSLATPILTQAESIPDQSQCLATREFVTALEFLRADDAFKLKDPEGRELAFKIAEGCTGAAKRFIRISKSLTAAGANRRDLTRVGLQFAIGTDAETDAFNTAFSRAIAEDSLDLDFDTSLKIAFSLSKEFSGDLKKVRDDFSQIVDFCANDQLLGLPRSECGPFAAKIARMGERWKDGVARPFIDTFQYLKSDSGPHLTTGDALKIAENLISQGAGGPENFKLAYQYGMSNSGLNLPRGEAIQFSKKLSALTRVEQKKDLKTEGLKSAPAKTRSL